MSTRNDYCCVVQCNSWSRKEQFRHLTFHKFPHADKNRVYMDLPTGRQLIDRRQAWIIQLKISKTVTKFMKVCSLHFTNADYLQREKQPGKRRMLKMTAIPTQKLPQLQPSSSTTVISKKNERTGQKRRKTKLENHRSERELAVANALIQLVNNRPRIND